MINEKALRENVLKGIRNASLIKIDNVYSSVNQDADIYADSGEDDSLVLFATELNNIGGSFVYCYDVQEFFNEISVLMKARNVSSFFSLDPAIIALLQQANISVDHNLDHLSASPYVITQCEALVARLGSVVVSSKQVSGRLANFIPDVHIVIATPNQVVLAVKDALEFIRNKYASLPSMISFVTGPSRTADIEKTLVMGAHGPREVIVFVIDNLIF